jgi:hypothetical protein
VERLSGRPRSGRGLHRGGAEAQGEQAYSAGLQAGLRNRQIGRAYRPSSEGRDRHTYGAPEVLEIRDVPRPVPGDDEVLVRVHASSVCYGDRIIRQGRFSSG